MYKFGDLVSVWPDEWYDESMEGRLKKVVVIGYDESDRTYAILAKPTDSHFYIEETDWWFVPASWVHELGYDPDRIIIQNNYNGDWRTDSCFEDEIITDLWEAQEKINQHRVDYPSIEVRMFYRGQVIG